MNSPAHGSKLAALVAATTLSAASFSPVKADPPEAPESTLAPLTIESPLNRAISGVRALVVELGFEQYPHRPFSPENQPKLQAVLDQWSSYSNAMADALGKNENGNSPSKTQQAFLSWIQEGLVRESINIPNVSCPDLDGFPGLSGETQTLYSGLHALLGTYGAIGWEATYDVVENPERPGSFLTVTHPPARIYAIEHENPSVWTNAFPELAEKKVPLLAVQRIGGKEYARNADGHFVDAGSFMLHGAACIDLAATNILTATLQTLKDGYLRNLAPLTGKQLEDVVAEILKLGQEFAGPPDTKPEERLKDGGFAIDCLIALAASDRGTAEFAWINVNGHRIREFAYHEGQHVLDDRPEAKLDGVIGRIRKGGLGASLDERIEAEMLAELHVRLESFKHSLTYPIQLLGEARAGFMELRGGAQVVAGQRAQREIFDAVCSELKADPNKWGISFIDKDVMVHGITFSPDQQIMAQFHAFARTEEMQRDMVEAVARRLQIAERKQVLASKYQK